MLQPGQDDLFASLFYFASEEDLVEDGINFVEVEDKVQFAHIAKECVQDFDKEVNGFEIR
jgi:hypothetical protein